MWVCCGVVWCVLCSCVRVVGESCVIVCVCNCCRVVLVLEGRGGWFIV